MMMKNEVGIIISMVVDAISITSHEYVYSIHDLQYD